MAELITPLRRKTLNATFDSPRGSFNLMRRKTMVTSTPVVVSEATNDDEAERRRLKQKTCEAIEEESFQKTVPALPINKMEEYISTCLRLSAENKINAKNVWKIHIIDYLKSIVDKESENSLQIASASLGVSAKVYGIRVDSVHTEVLKLASELNRPGANDKQQDRAEEGDDNEIQDDILAEGNIPKTKKKKKARSRTIATNEAIRGEPELMEIPHSLFAELNTRPGDINASENLLQAFIPISKYTGEFLVCVKTKFFDSSDGESKNEDHVCIKIQMHSKIPDDKLELYDICPPFAKFKLSDWSPEQEELRLTQQKEAQDNVLTRQEKLDMAFDMDAEPLPIMDITPLNVAATMESSDEEEIVNVDGNHGQGFRANIENIVDMRPTNPSISRNLEYSYNAISNGIWAGPAHWKFKSISVRPKARCHTSNTVGAPLTQRKKKRSAIEDISYINVPKEKPFLELSHRNQLKRETIVSWNLMKNLLPIDMHIIPNDELKLLANPSIKLSMESRPETRQSFDDHVEEYNYDNLNDSNFCPSAIDKVADDIPETNYNDDGGNDNHTDEDQEMFLGSNMVDAPDKVAKIYVPYAVRAKKVNMKNIKNAIWDEITGGNHKMADLTENNEKVVVVDTCFSKLYKKLPTRLPDDQAENITPALAFFALLHITNENNLTLTGIPDLSDLRITND